MVKDKRPVYPQSKDRLCILTGYLDTLTRYPLPTRGENPALDALLEGAEMALAHALVDHTVGPCSTKGGVPCATEQP